MRHFHDVVRRDHGVTLSYRFVKKLLQDAGLVKKRRPRGRHRLRRERRACLCEMLHLDGSPHAWLALVPDERQTLIAVLDDATSRVLYAQLHEAESTEAVVLALREVIGVPVFEYRCISQCARNRPNLGRGFISMASPIRSHPM